MADDEPVREEDAGESDGPRSLAAYYEDPVNLAVSIGAGCLEPLLDLMRLIGESLSHP